MRGADISKDYKQEGPTQVRIRVRLISESVQQKSGLYARGVQILCERGQQKVRITSARDQHK